MVSVNTGVMPTPVDTSEVTSVDCRPPTAVREVEGILSSAYFDANPSHWRLWNQGNANAIFCYDNPNTTTTSSSPSNFAFLTHFVIRVKKVNLKIQKRSLVNLFNYYRSVAAHYLHTNGLSNQKFPGYLPEMRLVCVTHEFLTALSAQLASPSSLNTDASFVVIMPKLVNVTPCLLHAASAGLRNPDLLRSLPPPPPLLPALTSSITTAPNPNMLTYTIELKLKGGVLNHSDFESTWEQLPLSKNKQKYCDFCQHSLYKQRKLRQRQQSLSAAPSGSDVSDVLPHCSQNISEYCPVRLFAAQSVKEIEAAISCLVNTPQNNLVIFKNHTRIDLGCWPASLDPSELKFIKRAVSEALFASNLLPAILNIQHLDTQGILGIYDLVHCKLPAEVRAKIVDLFGALEKNYEHPFWTSPLTSDDLISSAALLIRNFLISHSLKDASIMISLLPTAASNSSPHRHSCSGCAYSISIVDVDPKFFANIKLYRDKLILVKEFFENNKDLVSKPPCT